MTNLINHFTQRTDEIVDLLRQLVEIESPSTDKPATDRIAQFVAQVARDLGGSVTTHHQEQRGDHLVARWGEGPGGFLLLCHLDTVWPMGTLAERPWRVDGERAYGPGSLDDKAGVAIALMAMRGLQDLGFSITHPVTILFTSDEEIGSRSSRSLIEAEAAQAMVVFCMEPALPDGALKIWRKGTGRYTITALGQAAHSGADHAKGINAIEEMAHQILKLQNMTDYGTGTTVSVGWVRGGTRSNVIPDQAQIRLDVRVRTETQGRRVTESIDNLQPVLPGAHLRIEGGLSRPPMEESPLTLAPFQRAQKIGHEIGLELIAGGTGGASDGNFTAALGVPTLDGMGAIGDGTHAAGEYVQISSLPERASLMAALLTRW